MRSATVRHRIIAFLRAREASTAAEIGAALRLSTATVRHHLSVLQGDGRMVPVGTAATGRLGRPQRLYRLSEGVLGENMGLLADAALSAAWGQLKPSQQDAAVRDMADRLRQRLGEIQGSVPLAKRLVELTNRLNKLHYRAGWEAGARGPRVLFGHCPYAEIIEQHPELCRMDAHLLSQEMEADVEQLARIGSDPARREPTHCVFVLRAKVAGRPL